MAPKARSLHIGLNCVDPNAYSGWDGQLNACEADAQSMLGIVSSLGYAATQVLLTADAKADFVLGAIGAQAQVLESGDLFLLTYSGHGGRIPDPEKQGEQVDTWALYDRMLLSHELYRCWSLFKVGVRIFVSSDSCHSGTMTRLVPQKLHLSRAVPSHIAQNTYAANQHMYDAIARANPRGLRDQIQTPVLLISGCQDCQESSDGDENGLFTSKMLSVWNGGSFVGMYPQLYDGIVQAMPDLQTQKPNYFTLGENGCWTSDRPFTP